MAPARPSSPSRLPSNRLRSPAVRQHGAASGESPKAAPFEFFKPEPSNRVRCVLRFGIAYNLPMSRDPTDAERMLVETYRERAGSPEELFGLVYHELRQVAHAYMRRERADHTLQAT